MDVDCTSAPNDPSTPGATENVHSPRPEWSYPMRRSMQEVAPGVFLGPYSAAQRSKLSELKRHGITHIICVRHDNEARFIKPNFPEEFQYLTLSIADNNDENIHRYFGTVNAFIDEVLARGGKVLIHGNTGQSRSATLAAAYVMRKFYLDAEDGLGLVLRKRFCICPKAAFVEQLQEYGAQLGLTREKAPEDHPNKRVRLSSNTCIGV